MADAVSWTRYHDDGTETFFLRPSRSLARGNRSPPRQYENRAPTLRPNASAAGRRFSVRGGGATTATDLRSPSRYLCICARLRSVYYNLRIWAVRPSIAIASKTKFGPRQRFETVGSVGFPVGYPKEKCPTFFFEL